ncbi:MAG: S-layer homology domain-containing protein [Oscillospiraceae bacterium]
MKKLMFLFLVMLLMISGFSISVFAFSDVSSDAWYAEAVDYVVNNNLFQGTGDATFSPDGTMTRGMFCTVLGRMANVSTEFTTDGVITKTYVNMRSKPTTESDKLEMLDKGATVEVLGISDDWYKVRYDGMTGYIRNDLMSATVEGLADVPYNKYYSPYIDWAYKNGIASGTTGTTFSPNDPITREDICVYLAQYCSYFDLELPANVRKTAFSDEDLISDTNAVYTLQQAGIITGRDDGCFDPDACVKRAEVAALFQRYGSTDITSADTDPDDDYEGYQVFAKVPPLSDAVSTSYFDDACFIGHSLVVGMKNYFNLPNADFYAVSGISASSLLTYDRFPLEETYEDEDGNTVNELGTIADVLEEKSYAKIYVMLGVNELGPLDEHLDSYYNSMSQLVEMVKKGQPDATVYLISITPIGKTRSDNSENFNRTNVLKFNDTLQQVSVEQDVYYLDAFGAYCNASGYMPDEYATSDGIHILGSNYCILKNLIMTHAL